MKKLLLFVTLCFAGAPLITAKEDKKAQKTATKKSAVKTRQETANECITQLRAKSEEGRAVNALLQQMEDARKKDKDLAAAQKAWDASAAKRDLVKAEKLMDASFKSKEGKALTEAENKFLQTKEAQELQQEFKKANAAFMTSEAGKEFVKQVPACFKNE